MVRFAVSATAKLELSALVADRELRAISSNEYVYFNRPTTAGIRLTDAGIFLYLDEIRPDAAVVLCCASSESGRIVGAVRTGLLDPDGNPVAEFDVPMHGTEAALLCWEVYRRGDSWKVRALGQGYDGGLAQLLTEHGVEVAAPPPAPAAAAPQQHGLTIEPFDGTGALERIWMIYEDAARSAASFVSSRDYAMNRLDSDLSAAVADPATRNNSHLAQEEARRRADELVATARQRHEADCAHLTAELETVDPALPRSMASWNSHVWSTPTPELVAADGIRIGELSAPDRSPVRIPFCVPFPPMRPIWVNSTVASAALPVVGALLLRMLAAAPGTKLDVIDLGNALEPIVAQLEPLLAGPVVTDHYEVSARIESIITAADLAAMAIDSGTDLTKPPPRIVVVADFPYGLHAEDAMRLMQLTTYGPTLGWSVLIVGDDIEQSERAFAQFADASQHIPTVGLNKVLDPWTRNEWDFVPDVVPADPAFAARAFGTLLGG